MHTTPFPQALRDDLDQGLTALGLDTAALSTPLLAYLALLDRWNRTYNLTAIRDPREMVDKHLPGGHFLTIDNFRLAQTMSKWYAPAMNVYWAISVPITAALLVWVIHKEVLEWWKNLEKS